ncbi:MAG: type IV toxin-antitoxin system AbiEi family antitoxin domain-containing protein [Bifidobacteriaceae bacterium]|nr:type IV toxin-antitoxin system AbiEi family antitoxin domain-containing protein [Bifidobacteriaceae bacterium]
MTVSDALAGSEPVLLRYRDLPAAGWTRHALERAAARGEYERVAPGAFLRTAGADDTTAAWMAIATRRPEATLCLLSAAALHDLSDEMPRSSDIAVPRGTHPVKVVHAPIAWHRFNPATFNLGRERRDLGHGIAIGLYSPERTVIDLFAMRHETGADLAIEALKRWLRGRGHSPARLLEAAKPFPKARPAILSALEVLL